jgi:hypothetical protein
MVGITTGPVSVAEIPGDVRFKGIKAAMAPGERGAAAGHGRAQNWRRNRRSFSKKRRMSSTPYFSMAMRSMPRPKAKPV